MTGTRPITTTSSPAGLAGTVTIGTDRVVNRFGYGAMRLTGPGIFGAPADAHEAVRVLRRAVALGIEFIDTADSYGPNVSEELIAKALHPYRGRVFVATKGGLERPGPDQWIPNGRPDHLRRQLEGSLRRLKVDRIDLWQLHRIDPKVPADDQFGVLAEFLREGKACYVGLSEVSVADIERARQHVPIATVQNRYNLLDRTSEDVLDYCEQEGIVFIPWFPLGAGDLTREVRTARERLKRVARRHGATVMQVALAWLFTRSPFMLPIPGTSKVKHLEENVAAAALRLNDEDLRDLAGEDIA
jgi:pyridoxine 4-dehydrogenase